MHRASVAAQRTALPHLTLSIMDDPDWEVLDQSGQQLRIVAVAFACRILSIRVYARSGPGCSDFHSSLPSTTFS
jgi:hypothetical protein